MAFPTFLASVLIEFFGHNLPSRPPIVANEGASVGPESSNGVTESMGLRADLAPTCRPDPLIIGGLAALAPSSWDLDIAANRAPGAPLVMVANVSRQSGSVEALWKLCQTRRNATASRRSGGLFGECSVSLGQDIARWRVSPPSIYSMRTDCGVPVRPVLELACNSEPECQVRHVSHILAPCFLSSSMAPSDKSDHGACLVA